MALNKYMHPRNRYKHRPNFEALGEKYPHFKKYLEDNAKGKPVMDFQDPEALKALTICLLKEDYDLDIALPPDRLVPTLPLRLNYVHWIEDISKDWNKQGLHGIDIGTGPCCIYPVLATSANPWRFLATEADGVNFSYAVKNIDKNRLTERIKVVKVNKETILEGAIGDTTEVYDFCMCNPPFFADHMEAQGLVSRSPSRPEPKTMSTASPQESVVQGGEVAFVRKMIEESNFLQDRIRVYSTMLGKKSSLVPLKEILRRHKIDNFASTEFCQGKTMRWGLAWTFDKTVSFPKSQFSQVKKDGKKSVIHIIPTPMGERRERISDLVLFFKQIFSELKIHCREGKQTAFFALLTLTASENTWIHSRRKRRQMMREAAAAASTAVTSEAAPGTAQTSDLMVKSVTSDRAESPSKTGDQVKADSHVSNEDYSEDADTKTATISLSEEATQLEHVEHTPDTLSEEPTAKRAKLESPCPPSGDKPSVVDLCGPSGDVEKKNGTLEEVKTDVEDDLAHEEIDYLHTESQSSEIEVEERDQPPAQYVLKCHMCVRVQQSNLAVELTWLSGEDIQLMHQLMQVFKNRLAQR